MKPMSSDMFQEELKIPKDRIAVLIGKKGSTKRKLQKYSNTKIKINSEEGEVVISGEENLKVFLTKNIIKAIARGFNPDTAINLLRDNMYLEIINIPDFSKKSKKGLHRRKSRVIGTEGKARRNIERLTNTKISVYGKTICIIGTYEDISNARKAIEMLLQGSPHGNVYKWLEKHKKKEMENEEI